MIKTDSQLYTEIMEKLEFEPEINPLHISLSVNEGIIILAGTVRYYAEKRKVERAIRGVEGVKGIVNDLKVNLLTDSQRNDTDIARAVINALEWDINVPSDKIKVKIEDGFVQLRGEVEWFYQRNSAEKAIRCLAGVRGVDNQIKVNPPIPIISSSEVKEKIRKEFERNALIDAEKIQIEIRGSEILLKGEVRSFLQYKEAQRAAWSVPGVSQVENQLKVI